MPSEREEENSYDSVEECSKPNEYFIVVVVPQKDFISTDTSDSTEKVFDSEEDIDLPDSVVTLFIRLAVIASEPEANFTHSPVILVMMLALR